MRNMCLAVLLLLAASGLAAQTSSEGTAPNPQPQFRWKAFQSPDGTFQFRTLPDAKGRRFAMPLPGSDTCYFIRSYVMKRDDDGSDAVHLDRVTTCTPKPRVRMRSTIRVLPAVR